MHERKPMTVKEVAEYLLANYPHDMRVLGDAYEEGYNDPLFIERTVYKKEGKHYWDGQYEDYMTIGKGEPFQAVTLNTALRTDRE